MKKIYSLLFLSFFASKLFSQQPYTTSQFVYDSIVDMPYGTALDYAGNTQTLVLDLYKPKNDGNCLRPVIVLVHGGAWIGGSKADAYLRRMSRFMAQRGWVVANINYRLGTHKAANYSMYAVCNTDLSQPCGYISDSAEVYRANFRAMQDAKGAIRFMKNRSAIDSSDVNNVFIAGESAGAFVALAAAFTDQASEKAANCFSITNAPNPDSDMNTYNCIPANNDLSRPDLGSIDGTLNLGTHDASVKGVGSIYGGVFNFSIFQQNGNSPVVYLFHQGSDVVVHYKYGRLLGRTSFECYGALNICQPYYFYPMAHGGDNIRQHFVSLMTAAPVNQADIVSNYTYQGNCFSNGHSIDNFETRLQNMTNLFATRIALSGNNPNTNCATVGVGERAFEKSLFVFPNPSKDKITLHVSKQLIESGYVIFDPLGKQVNFGKISAEKTEIDISKFSKGIYFLNIPQVSGQQVKIVVE